MHKRPQCWRRCHEIHLKFHYADEENICVWMEWKAHSHNILQCLIVFCIVVAHFPPNLIQFKIYSKLLFVVSVFFSPLLVCESAFSVCVYVCVCVGNCAFSFLSYELKLISNIWDFCSRSALEISYNNNRNRYEMAKDYRKCFIIIINLCEYKSKIESNRIRFEWERDVKREKQINRNSDDNEESKKKHFERNGTHWNEIT